MSHLRLFLGISLPPDWRKAIQQWIESQPSINGLHWTPAANWHITQYFFGNIPPEMLDNLKALLTLGLKDAEPFSLELDQFCLAPQASRPRMIWARFHRHPVFQSVVEQVHPLFLQIQPEHQMRHKPIPHITLARIRQPDELDQIQWPLASPDSFPITELILFQSVQEEGRTHYKPLHNWILR